MTLDFYKRARIQLISTRLTKWSILRQENLIGSIVLAFCYRRATYIYVGKDFVI